MAELCGKRDRADIAARGWERRRGASPRGVGCLVALWRAEKGLSAVEFALAVPILLALIVPVIDLGLAFSAQMKVQQAAQAGGQYASVHGYDSTKITSAITGATTLSVSASPTPTQSCGCLSGTTVTLSGTPPCTTTCTNGLTPGTYVTANAQASYAPLVPYASVLSNPTTLTAVSTVRIQ